MKVYISGKITGLPIAEAKAKFDRCKSELIMDDYEPVSPMDLPHDHDKSWASYMIECLIALKECEAIHMLPCWKDSPGAMIEHDFAKRMGIQISYE